jgi:hypothetical protein
MHTGRRRRPRGGKSDRRKRIRESFWEAVDSREAEQDTPSPNLPDLEEEDLSKPVVTLQPKAKALRRRINPRPDSTIGGGASSSGAFPAAGSMFPFAVLAG